METVIFLCKDNTEGILTGVYDAWAEALASGLGHGHCRLATKEAEPELFCRYQEVESSADKAEKVIRTIRKRLGEEVYMRLCYAMSSCAPDKAEAVYKTVVAGFSMKRGAGVFDRVTDPYVVRCFDLQRNVGREIHSELEFLRFRELENGVLLAKINPKNNVLMYLGNHFSDRLPLENFMIYDTNRHTALFHEKQKDWYMMDAFDLNESAEKRYSAEEAYYQDLFRLFCHTISIQSRENLNLQRQHLPLRFRDYMPEF